MAAPVYLAYGLLTEEFMVHRVQILAGLLPDLWIEAFPGVHHFGPPQRTQPARYARSLRFLWARVEGRPPTRPAPAIRRLLLEGACQRRSIDELVSLRRTMGS